MLKAGIGGSGFKNQNSFGADSQLEQTLINIFNKTHEDMKFDENEISEDEEGKNNQSFGSPTKQRTNSFILDNESKNEFMQSLKKPKPIEIFEDMCQQTFDKAPAIFKKMQKGKLNLTE